MAIYDLYEIDVGSIVEARSLLEAILSLSLEERDSSFHHGPYFAAGKTGEENFELKFNLDPYENEPSEGAYPNAKFLFYVNNTKRSPMLGEILSKANGSIKLLRHENL
ncbi:MAG: hypothetical protein LBF16_02350 [Pseudomonadales bacterium]|nr:hypothetical protein [Pseudomonadales bacterium]